MELSDGALLRYLKDMMGPILFSWKEIGLRGDLAEFPWTDLHFYRFRVLS